MKSNKLINLLFVFGLLLVAVLSANSVLGAIDWDNDVELFIPMADYSEPTGLIDIGPNGHNGTAVGGIGLNSEGTAFVFDGSDDYVQFGDVNDLDFGTNDFSMSAWINVSSSTPSFVVIAQKRGGGAPTLGYSYHISNVGRSSATVSSNFYSSFGAQDLRDDKLYNAIMVFNRTGSEIRVYINGSLDGTQAGVNSDSVSSTNFFTIGSDYQSGSPTQFFLGEMSDLIMFNKALTPEEVNEIYTNGQNYNPYDIIVLENIKPIGDILNKTDISFDYINRNNENANITIYLNNVSVYTQNNVANGTAFSYEPNVLYDGTEYEWFANILTASETINTSTYSFKYLPNEIHFEDEDTNPLENITVSITYPDSSEVSYQTDSNGNVTFPFVYLGTNQYGTYNIDLSGNQGYQDLSITEEVTTLNAPLQENYTVQNAKINITIYDRETGNLLSGVDVEIDILGLLTNTTNTGNLVIENASIIAGDYTLQSIADGYLTEQRTFSFTNQEVLDINIYMLNATGLNTGFAIISIQDEFYRILSEADVRLLEYDSSSLSFIEVSQCYADSNGECTFGVELDKKTYIAQATKTIGNVNYFGQTSTQGERFLEDPSLRTIRLKLLDPFSTQAINNLVYSIDQSFNNNISSISVDFYTTDGLATEVCTSYYLVDIGYENKTYEECKTTSASQQTISTNVLLDREFSYEARVTQTYQGELYVLKKFYYPSELSLIETLKNSNYARPFIILIAGALLGLALYFRNITFFFGSIIIFVWTIQPSFSEFILLSGAVLITLINAFSIYIARKPKEFN